MEMPIRVQKYDKSVRLPRQRKALDADSMVLCKGRQETHDLSNVTAVLDLPKMND